MKKLAHVILLPASNDSHLRIVNTDLMGFRDRKRGMLEEHDSPWPTDEHFISQHLYICAPQETKEMEKGSKKHYIQTPTAYREIIATTDSSLKEAIEMIGTGSTYIFDMSSIPQSFINKYIEQYNKGNNIKKVMVEYEIPATIDKEDYAYFGNNQSNLDYIPRPKLNGNEIIICEEEGKLYTKAEVEKSYHNNLILKAKSFSGGPWIKVEDINEWIKNL